MKIRLLTNERLLLYITVCKRSYSPFSFIHQNKTGKKSRFSACSFFLLHKIFINDSVHTKLRDCISIMQVSILLLFMLVLCLTVESGVHRHVQNDDDASTSEADSTESEQQVKSFNCPSCGLLHLPCCSPKVCRRPIFSFVDKCVWAFGK